MAGIQPANPANAAPAAPAVAQLQLIPIAGASAHNWRSQTNLNTMVDPLARQLVLQAQVQNTLSLYAPGVRRDAHTDDRPPVQGSSPYDLNFLSEYVLPAVNGSRDSATQTVTVGWLEPNQHLILPLGLYAEENHGRPLAVWSTVLAIFRGVNRYLDQHEEDNRPMEYGDILSANAALASAPVADYRAAPAQPTAYFDLIEADPRPDPDTLELQIETASIRVAISGNATIVFVLRQSSDEIAAQFAMTTGLNYDPRDYRVLSGANMTMTDDAHLQRRDDADNLKRLRSKLHAYTITNIAALNYAAVDESPLLAWSRAYMVSAGILHSRNSTHSVETSYTRQYPLQAHLQQVTAYNAQQRDQDLLLRKAYSICAAFGAQHLNRDHTYKPSDPVISRSNVAYTNALRTVLSDADMTEARAKPAAYMRTAFHPFGLAQTFYVHQWGLTHNRIAEPLAARETPIPPPAQRASFMRAGLQALRQMPIGNLLCQYYSHEVDVLDNAIEEIQQSPTSYSSLYRHYGHDRQAPNAADTVTACVSVGPIVAGYALAFYIYEDNQGQQKSTGLALAASILNIERDAPVAVQMFKDMFDKYRMTALDQGIETFIAKQVQALRGGNAGAIVPV